MDAAGRLQVLALEPWLSGSHAQFLEQWARHSRHDVRVVGLAGRDWKWRMRAGAWELARTIAARGLDLPDVLWASDYVDVPSLYGHLPHDWASVPCVLYFHENQLSYPSRPTLPGEPAHATSSELERDLSLGFVHVLSVLRASAVVFNSAYHRDDFARAARELLARLPRPNPRRELEHAWSRSQVIAPGIELDAIPLGAGPPPGSPLRVVFNHRWEHDKDPLAFLHAVQAVQRSGERLELVLLGERFESLPSGAAELLDLLEPHVVERGYLADRGAYYRALASSDVAVSTARQEFFGLAIAEAMAAGCRPILPRRLAYPELVPTDAREELLYSSPADLVGALTRAARAPDALRSAPARAAMRAAAARHDARVTAPELDDVCSAVHGERPRTRDLQEPRTQC